VPTPWSAQLEGGSGALSSPGNRRASGFHSASRTVAFDRIDQCFNRHNCTAHTLSTYPDRKDQIRYQETGFQKWPVCMQVTEL
jgi:hypothetical protein